MARPSLCPIYTSALCPHCWMLLSDPLHPVHCVCTCCVLVLLVLCCSLSVLQSVLPARFRSGRQQDIHEFKTFLFDTLDKCSPVETGAAVDSLSLPSGAQGAGVGAGAREGGAGAGSASGAFPAPTSASIIKDLFGGTQAIVMKCMHCNRSSCRFEPFVELTVGFPRRFTPITDIIAVVVPRFVWRVVGSMVACVSRLVQM